MEHFRRLDVAQTRHALSEGAVLLDVREDFEWAAGHAPDAVHIPLSQLPARLHEIPQHRHVLVICRSGNRSAQAASIMRDHGFEHVIDAGALSDASTATGIDIVTE